MADTGFSIDGWAEFVENFAKFVDSWEAKKAILLKRMGNIYLNNMLPFVPVDTSRLVDSISLFTEGIPDDYVEVGTNVKYAIYVDEGHVQHKRFLPADKLTVGGKAKYLKSRDQKGIMLKESYVQGAHFLDKGLTAAKPSLTRLVNSFMEECAREVEGGR
ncbi:HK97 gp10 family phage protein [Hominenteromicrobium sp.]|jgi:hypothetical protein|uniref:HK97 gp10 family phage protein n=1 Tax=Hominenteromicrobium sp. TaxID=3073581 RepID=UPI00206549B7|nr:MAG TPA: putative tail component [Caudoviricetes sp.]